MFNFAVIFINIISCKETNKCFISNRMGNIILFNGYFLTFDMAFEIKHINVGSAIEDRRKQLDITKTELGRRINVPQQHVNRILERETMETNKLVQVSEALEFNFFELFCPNKDERVSAKNAAVAYNGNVTNTQVGDRVVDGSLAVANIQIVSLQNELDTLKNSNATLHNNLEDKERIIAMKQEKIDMMQKVMDLMQEKIDALEGR